MALGGLTTTITINAVAKVLNRRGQDNSSAWYYLKEADREFTLNVRHSQSTRQGVKYDRHNVELIELVFATPTTPSVERKQYVTFENLRSDDFTNTQRTVSGLLSALDAATVTQLLSFVS